MVPADDPQVYGSIFSKLKGIYELLLSDPGWSIRNATMRGIEHFAKYSIYDFKDIIPERHLGTVLQYLKHECKSPVRLVRSGASSFHYLLDSLCLQDEEFRRLKLQQLAINQILVSRKRGMPLTTPDPKRYRSDRLQEGLMILQEELQLTAAPEHQQLLFKAITAIEEIQKDK